MDAKDLPKGRIRKCEYLAVMDGLYYDVFSVSRKREEINLGFENGTFWTPLENIEKLVKLEEVKQKLAQYK